VPGHKARSIPKIRAAPSPENQGVEHALLGRIDGKRPLVLRGFLGQGHQLAIHLGFHRFFRLQLFEHHDVRLAFHGVLNGVITLRQQHAANPRRFRELKIVRVRNSKLVLARGRHRHHQKAHHKYR
jgi:hypothetical protein